MSGARRTMAPKSEAGLSRRLIAVVRGVVAAVLRPARAASVARLGRATGTRREARLELAAGSQVNYLPTVANEPAASVPLGHDTSDPASPPVGPASRPPAAVNAANVRPDAAAKRDELFWAIRVEPEFRPRDYASTFAALQLPWSAKLFDLTHARLISADLFEQLATAWTAPMGVVPRLGILLSFERWVALRETVEAALRPLAAHGVRVGVFYDEQAWGGGLATWFSHGRLVHNVPAVIETLTQRWHPSELWPMVIDMLAVLARANTCTAELPALLTEIAALALSCGGAVHATRLTREALDYLPEMPPSAIRGRALRELGTALIGRGYIAAGLAHLDQAIAVAALVQDSGLGASALAQSGLCALNHGDFENAEWRFRAAIALLAPSPWRPHLLAQAHHSLAVTLMHQGSDEAEHHAVTALALRSDPQSHLAEEDRILLSMLRDARMQLN